MDAYPRPGTRRICTVDANTLPMWERLKKAACRGDARQTKKQLRALQEAGKRQVTP